MIRRLALATVLSLLTVLALDSVLEPVGAAGELQITEIDVADHPTVSLVVTTGALASEDVSSAFSVREGGELRPAAVERLSTDGLEVVLAIDTSGSMQGEPILAARDAATAFVQSLPRSTPVAVIGFGAAPSVAAPFSTDRAAAIAAISGLAASGETALYDAVRNAATMPGAAGKRAIVLLSDGGDTVSTSTIDEAIIALDDANPMVSIVELVSPESDHASLERLVAGRDGRVLPAGDLATLRDAYASVTTDLNGRYRISYESTHAGETEVVVGLRAGSLNAHTSKRVALPGTAAAAALHAPQAAVQTSPGFLGSNTALLVGGGLLAIALTGIFGTIFVRPRRTNRLSGARRRLDTDEPALAHLGQRVTAAAERTLDRRDARRGIDAALEQAGIALRAGEIVVLAVVGSIAALAIGSMLLGPIGGIAFAPLGVLATVAVVRIKRTTRRKQFDDQLDQLLQMIAGSLRTGYGLSQAIEAASRELEAPAADELRRVSTEVRLGRDLIDALDEMSARVDNEDFGWVAQAIRIHREVGGNLSEVLDRVSETIRARGRLQRQVRALSAEGRLSAIVISALPFVSAVGMAVLNPSYIRILFTTGAGIALLGLAGVLMSVGGLWLRRLIRPTF